MLDNLSSTQKAVGGIVVIAGVAGWIFSFVQIGEINNLKSELGPARQDLASAKNELAQLQGDLEATQSERRQLQQRVEATESLEELTAALEAGNTQLLSLQSKIEGSQAELEPLRAKVEGSQAELETLRAKVQRQQALLEGSMLQFKTNSRAKVRVGPGTDTDEVAVVPAGKTLQVFEIVEDGTWYKVGGMGYIFHELLEPVE